MPIKYVNFKKYKHKKSQWITNGLIKSIKFCDNLYKKLKLTSRESPEYHTLKITLQTTYYAGVYLLLNPLTIVTVLINLKTILKKLGQL